MNKRMVFYILCRMMLVEAVVLVVPAVVSLIYREYDCMVIFLVTAAVTALVCLPGGIIKPKNTSMYAKEGLVVVGLAWFVWSAVGALPYIISGYIPNFFSAFFETVSGFTTTGSTILSNIEVLPHGLLFWRSLTHLIGGMGVLVLVMAIVPLSDSASMHLMRAEMPGPTVGKLVPRGRSTAKVLYLIYFVMTAVLIVLLVAGGMPVFDSFIHAFGTAGTGGFSNMNASVGAYNSAYIDVVLTIFMLLFGVNFNLYYYMLLRRFEIIGKNRELRTYIGIIIVSILLVTFSIREDFSDFLTALRHGAFQVASIMSTTGFSTVDFDLWPQLAKTVLLVLMIIGACAGSTGGGIKISRIMILIRSARYGLQRNLNPRRVSSVRGDEGIISTDTIFGVFLYITVYILVLIFATLLLSFDNYDFETNFSAVLACLNNVGPGFAAVGPTCNFGIYSGFSKLVLSFTMLFGRLEFLPLVVLFAPSTWRKKFM